MRVEIFSLCDAATVDTSGKLNLLGAFDTVWVTSMPTIYPQCAIALRIRFENIESGEHRININFVDADGRHILPALNSMVNINFSEGQRSGSSNSVLNIQGLRLERYGEYSIDLAIDGREEASLPFFVKPRLGL